MGNPKQKWSAEEEAALRAGVAKHGAGRWKLIQSDPQFKHLLNSRSNIDLKDKWRNLGVANRQVPEGDQRPGANPAAETPDAPHPLSQDEVAVVDAVIVESTKPVSLGKNANEYNAMIFEALSTLKQPNGSDYNAIATFIEQRQDVPPYFRRLLTSRLRRLVIQEKLEKVQNCYKIKTVQKAKPPAAIPLIDLLLPRPVPGSGILGNTVEEASISAAIKVAEAESKEFVAAESVKEAERVAKMAEDSEAFLQCITYCFDLSAYGEITLKV